MKTHEFPLIKFRDGDNMPGVWFGNGLWFLVKDTLCRKYLEARADVGDRQALIELKKAKDYDLWPFSAGAADDAIRYYSIGWEAYEKGRVRPPTMKMYSPDELILVGNRAQTESYEKTKAKLMKEANNEHAA